MNTMTKYKIDYGYGIATLYTAEKDVEQRFYTLACTCFGIRKSIAYCNVIQHKHDDREDQSVEQLEFNGDCYIWRDDGARKMLEPWADAEWNTDYCEECKLTDTKEGQRDDCER